MPEIAQIGSIVTVTPSDAIQIVYGPGNHEFVDDRSPFSLKVSGLIEQEQQIIGVYGSVVSGPERYQGLIATLLIRLNNSDWTRDNYSAAGFKVGRSAAKPNGRHEVYHPNGTDIEGFPFIIRFGTIESRAGNEQVVNSANVVFHKSVHEFIERIAQRIEQPEEDTIVDSMADSVEIMRMWKFFGGKPDGSAVVGPFSEHLAYPWVHPDDIERLKQALVCFIQSYLHHSQLCTALSALTYLAASDTKGLLKKVLRDCIGRDSIALYQAILGLQALGDNLYGHTTATSCEDVKRNEQVASEYLSSQI